MKVKLKKSLPDYPAGTVFKYNHDHINWMPADKDEYVYDWLRVLLEEFECHPDWFERIDETPLYWEPEKGDRYFYVGTNGNGEVVLTTNEYFTLDKDRISVGNAFPTQEAAQAHVEYLKALTRVRKWISEQGFEVLGEGEPGYDLISSGMISTSHKDNPVLPKLKSMNDAHQVIDNCQDDLKTIFGVES